MRPHRWFFYFWAAPASALGLAAGILTLCSGGNMRRVLGTLEFHGGFARWLLSRTPVPAAAMTLGHVIIGRDHACLAACRPHEHVHVGQFERWGPFFIPAYLAASLLASLQGKHFYFDNHFEIDARRRAGEE